MEDVSNTMEEIQNTSMPESMPQFRITVVPDFNSESSLVILKIHHVMADGLALIILMGALQDEYSPGQFIQTSQTQGLLKKFGEFLLSPFSIVYAGMFFLFWPAD
jgi:NRPS condensation-like uncharacterized protein